MQTKFHPRSNSVLAASGRAGLLTLALSLGWGLGQSADAQSAAPPTAPPASASGAPSNGVGDVVVTAEFRQTKLQQTPLAISAITAQTLQARGEMSVTDIAATVPNTVISPLGSGWGATEAAFIRGIGLGDNILSFEPGVPIYVDDVYNGRPQGSIFDLLDLDRIEVLRGPQGTLFGKNAVGGAVRLISKKPSGDGSGYFEGSYGRFNRVNLRGAWDISLVPDKVFLRVSGSSKHADGYFTLLDYVCVHGAGSLGNIQSAVGQTSGDCVTGHLGSEGVDSGRAALRILASPTVELNIVGDYTRQRQEAPPDKYTAITNVGFESLWNGVSEGLYGSGVDYDGRFVTSSPYTSYARYGTNPADGRLVPNENNMDHWGVAGTIDWDAAPMLHIKSVTAYRDWWNTFGRSDASPLGNSSTFDDSTHKQFTEELQLTGTVGRLDYAAGAFYYHADDSNSGYDALLPPVAGLPGGVYDHDLLDTQTTKDWAVFVHGVYHFTDQLSLTAGVRYTNDQKNAIVSVTSRPPNPAADFRTPVNVKATRWNPTVELQYQFTPTFMTYAEYSTGFRGGGFSPRPNDALQVTPFGPEDVKNYELGFKSELFERRVRLNADIFYMTDDGQQNFKSDCAPCAPFVPWFHAVNAGDSTNEGFEVELQARPVEGLQIDSSLGYLRYRLKANEAQRTVLLCTTFADGTPCPQTRAPKWTFSAGVQYKIPVGTVGSLTPRLDVQATSRIYFATFSDTCSVAVAPGAACPAADIVPPPLPTGGLTNPAGGLGYQPGYMLLNGRLTWASADDKWSASLLVTNLTNKAYFYGKLALYALLGREQGNIAPPRQWLVTVRRDF